MKQPPICHFCGRRHAGGYGPSPGYGPQPFRPSLATRAARELRESAEAFTVAAVFLSNLASAFAMTAAAVEPPPPAAPPGTYPPPGDDPGFPSPPPGEAN